MDIFTLDGHCNLSGAEKILTYIFSSTSFAVHFFFFTQLHVLAIKIHIESFGHIGYPMLIQP